MLKQRVGELLLEALQREGDAGLRQLPVVDGSAVAGHGGRRGEGVARLRQLASESMCGKGGGGRKERNIRRVEDELRHRNGSSGKSRFLATLS